MSENKMSIKSPMFDEALRCVDLTLTNMLKNMIEKKVETGTITLKILVDLDKKESTYLDSDGETVITDSVVMPHVEWKVGSAMKLELKTDGDLPLLNQALSYNAKTNEWELFDCSNQLSMFD